MDDAETTVIEEQPAAAPAPEESPSAPSSTPEPRARESAPEPPKTRREAIERAVKASREPVDGKSLRDRMIEQGVIKPAEGQPRAPDGKFATRSGEAPAAKVAPQPAVPAAVTPKAIPLPKALKAELAPVWEQTPEQMRAAFAKYVEDASKGIDTYKTRAAEAEAVLNEFKPYEATLRAEGGTPQRAIRDLLNTAYVLRTGTPAQKAQLIAQTMNAFGISPDHVGAVLQGQVPQGQAPADPRYDQLVQQVQALRTQLEAEQERKLVSVADQFKTRPHWDLLRPHVADLLSKGEVEGADETAMLDAAYTKALQLFPVISQAEAEAQRQAALKAERERANAAAAKARQASVQVTGAPGGPVAPAFDPKDRRSVIAHAMRVQTR